MHKLQKTVFAIIFGITLTSAQALAQVAKKPATAVKKPTAPASAVKKPAVAVAKPAAVSSTAVMLKSSADSLSAAIGISFSNSLMSQGITNINTDILNKTINASLSGGKPALSIEVANMFLQEYFGKIMAEKQKEAEANGAVVRQEGEKFLEENKKKPGIVTTESGLQYQVIKMGEGAKPTATDKVKTHYHGTLTNGTVFDSSVDRGEPIEFEVGGVIKGWTEALQLMPVGSKWKLFIPYQLAYGERAAGPQIPAYSALVFDVELLDIVK
jgi:FKBP-type peptidyl-prolyl cis-trans isomerase FklB